MEYRVIGSFRWPLAIIPRMHETRKVNEMHKLGTVDWNAFFVRYVMHEIYSLLIFNWTLTSVKILQLLFQNRCYILVILLRRIIKMSQCWNLQIPALNNYFIFPKIAHLCTENSKHFVIFASHYQKFFVTRWNIYT